MLVLLTMMAVVGAPNALETQLSEGIAAEARARLGLGDAAEVSVARLDAHDSEAFSKGSRLVSFELASKGRPLGWTTVKVTVERKRVRAEHWVRAEVVVKVPTLVATRPLARGQVLEDGDVRVELSPLGFDKNPSVEQVLGGRLKVDVDKGVPIAERWVERPEVIRRGSKVHAVVAGSAFAVRAPAEALENGAIGDEVAVRVVLGKRVVRGVVTGPGEVEVR